MHGACISKGIAPLMCGRVLRLSISSPFWWQETEDETEGDNMDCENSDGDGSEVRDVGGATEDKATDFLKRLVKGIAVVKGSAGSDMFQRYLGELKKVVKGASGADNHTIFTGILEKVPSPHLRQLGQLNAASARNYQWLGNHLSKTAIYHEQQGMVSTIKELADTIGRLYSYATVYGYTTRYYRRSGFSLQKDILTILESRAAQGASQVQPRGGLGRLIGL